MRPLRTLPNGGPARFSLILMRFSRRAQLLGLAKRHAISTIFDRRERGGFTAEGSSAHLADSDVLVRN